MGTEPEFQTRWVHWMVNPLDEKEIGILRAVARGSRPLLSERFFTAHLIARGCLEFDSEDLSVSLTEKGKDALAYQEATRWK